MADLLGNDADYEVSKYLEAEVAFEAGQNPAIEKDKKSVFNVQTGTHDILLPMDLGGYIKIGEEGEVVDPPQSILIEGMEFGPDTPEFQRYYPAPQPEVMEEALLPEVMETVPDQPAMPATESIMESDPTFVPAEALTPDQITERLSSGEPLVVMSDRDPTIRDSVGALIEAMTVSSLTEGLRSELLEAQGVSPTVIAAAAAIRASAKDETDPSVEQRARQLIEEDARQRNAQVNFRTIDETIRTRTGEFRALASVYSNAAVGTGETNPLQVGVGDFATGGAMDIQEGYRMFGQNNDGGAPISPLYSTTGLVADVASTMASTLGSDVSSNRSAGRLMGLGLMAAGIAEATGVGKPIAILIKKGLKLLEPSLIKAGAEAEQRIAQEGSTMFSNPVGPIVDRGLAAAGKLVAPDLPDASDLAARTDSARLAYDASPNDTALKKEYFDLRKERDANPIAEVQAPTENKPGIIAFSGSGKDFEKFSIEYINTGEGAQAYGNGLYFSSAESIANFYQKAVRQAQNLREGYDVSYKGKLLKNFGDTAEAEAQGQEYDAINNIIANLNKVTTIETRELPQPELIQLAKDNFIKERKRQRARYVEDISERDGSDSKNWEELSRLIVESFDDEIKVVKGISVNDVSFSEGKTYQVDLDVTQNELLDYDKSFQEQTPFVQTAILKALEEITIDDAVNFGAETVAEAQKLILDNFTTVRFLNDFSAVRGSNDAGEKLLDKHGVKGIKYKANRGSGNAPEDGPDNYVIFDDRTIQILKKYGIVGPVSLAAVASNGESKEGAANGI